VLALPHPDWLYNSLTISGPAEQVEDFKAAAAGAGVIPWHYDYDALEENWFLLLAAPRPPKRRSISLAGARIVARQLRDEVWRLHETALAAVGHLRSCPFDLHALVPVPIEFLRLGPDHPDSTAWLWQNWGTTWPLRHVTRLPDRRPDGPDGARYRLGFWSADWTPWRALQRIAARWPGLRFVVQPDL
jgi:hypothetical protein